MTEKTTRAKLFAAGVIARPSKRGLEFLVMDVETLNGPKAGRVLVKLPGGKSEPRDKEDHIRVLRRELREEIGLHLKYDATTRHLATRPFGKHIKRFFLVWRSAFNGQLRTKGPIPDGRSSLGVPRWVCLAELEETLCQTHQLALPELRRILSLPPRAAAPAPMTSR